MSETVFTYSSKGLEAELKNSRRMVVGELSFALAEGETIALIGETGSGKTLTALSILGLLPENIRARELKLSLSTEEGRREDEELFQEAGSDIVYIPQNGLESLDHSVKVKRHLYDMLKKNGCGRALLEKEALSRLSAVGFGNPKEILNLYPFQLSGGMAQRVTIALAMTGRARLVIADEPTNGLDRDGRKSFLTLLEENFPKAGKLLITHDIALSSSADRVLVLKNGVKMEEGPSEAVLSQPKSPYTKALLGALVENGLEETPILREEASCCPFHSRCPEAAPECQTPKTWKEGDREWRCRR